ncbi:hypothetical protein KY334_04305 [Candidatus Woesearchaeota archaeon]|nr:hypothetical protein [Candidatus Woesearchaeota archaeon]
MYGNYDPTKTLEAAMIKIAAKNNKIKAEKVKNDLKNKIKVKINNKTTIYLSEKKYNEIKLESEQTGKSIEKLYNERFDTYQHKKDIRINNDQYIKAILIKYNLKKDELGTITGRTDPIKFKDVAKIVKAIKNNTTLTSDEICKKLRISQAKLHNLLYRVRI